MNAGTIFGIADVIMMIVGMGSAATISAVSWEMERADYVAAGLAIGSVVYFLVRMIVAVTMALLPTT